MGARARRRVGDVVRIPLHEEHMSGYGRVLEDPLFAFYDIRSHETPTIKEILGRPILFRIWVSRYALAEDRWEVVGHASLERALRDEPRFAKVDPITGETTIYWGNNHEIPATRTECKGLERAAVWEPEQVEERLRDHFYGRPNSWVEKFKL